VVVGLAALAVVAGAAGAALQASGVFSAPLASVGPSVSAGLPMLPNGDVETMYDLGTAAFVLARFERAGFTCTPDTSATNATCVLAGSTLHAITTGDPVVDVEFVDRLEPADAFETDTYLGQIARFFGSELITDERVVGWFYEELARPMGDGLPVGTSRTIGRVTLSALWTPGSVADMRVGTVAQIAAYSAPPTRVAASIAAVDIGPAYLSIAEAFDSGYKRARAGRTPDQIDRLTVVALIDRAKSDLSALGSGSGLDALVAALAEARASFISMPAGGTLIANWYLLTHVGAAADDVRSRLGLPDKGADDVL
jgi:hypothetical protein